MANTRAVPDGDKYSGVGKGEGEQFQSMEKKFE